MESFEVSLVKQAQLGDLNAFNRLVALHDRSVYRMAMSIVSNVDDAADVYQETFLRAFKKITTYKFDGPFSAWLNRIAVNLSINARKKRNRHRWFSLHGESGEHNNAARDIADRAPNPERSYLSREIDARVQLALDALSPQQRAIFSMKHLQGMKISEISEVLNCAEGSVKNQLFRAIQKLKKQLKELNEPLV